EPGDPVLPLVRERIRDLFKNLPLAMAGQEEPVHQVRVASRRLRVILPVAAVRPKGKKVRRAIRRLKDVTRVAGASRDLDVSSSLLPGVLARQGCPPPTAAILLRRLRAARGRARRKMIDAMFELDLSGLRRGLAKVAGKGGSEASGTLERLP